MTSNAAAEAVRLLLRGPPDDLCLAFVNTRYWRGTATPTEELRAPADLAAWCEGTAALGRRGARPGAGGGRRAASPRRWHCARRCSASSRRPAPGRRRRRTISARSTRRSPPPRPAPACAARRAACAGTCRAEHGAARPGAVVGGRPAGRPAARARAAMREPAMPLAVPRRQQGRHAPLVLDVGLRQPRQGAPALRAAKGGAVAPAVAVRRAAILPAAPPRHSVHWTCRPTGSSACTPSRSRPCRRTA